MTQWEQVIEELKRESRRQTRGEQTMKRKIYVTRYPELGYMRIDNKIWRIVSKEDIKDPGAVGPYYHSKMELLADLDRYAKDYGCT